MQNTPHSLNTLFLRSSATLLPPPFDMISKDWVPITSPTRTPANSQLEQRRILRCLLSRMCLTEYWMRFFRKKNCSSILYRIILHNNFYTKIIWVQNWTESQSRRFLPPPSPPPTSPFPLPRTLLPQHLHICTSKLYAVHSTSYFFYCQGISTFPLQSLKCFSTCSRFLPSRFFLPVVFTTFLCLIFLLYYSFLLSHNFVPKSTKKKVKKKGKTF